MVAISTKDGKVKSVGVEARDMLGRTPETIEVVRPLRDGVIADYMVTQEMLRYFISKACGRFSLVKPEVMICIPAGTTSVETRAVRDAALHAGARRVYLIREPLAAAIGAKIPVRSEEHTSELQSRQYLVCRLLLEKKKITRLTFS